MNQKINANKRLELQEEAAKLRRMLGMGQPAYAGAYAQV
jgi:hypothetical protein